MTDMQKKRIVLLRSSGLGYGAIAKRVEASKDSVKSFCRTHDLSGTKGNKQEDTVVCRHCGKPLSHTPGKRKRLYCSEVCRRSWWKAHPHMQRPRKESLHQLTCPQCGLVFPTIRSKNRKYCSHQCYIAARFGKESQ